MRQINVSDVIQRPVEIGQTIRLDLYRQGVFIGHDAAGSGDRRVHVDAERVLDGGVVEFFGAGEVRGHGRGRRVDDGDVLVDFGDGVGLEALPAVLEVAAAVAVVARVRAVQVLQQRLHLRSGRPLVGARGPAQLHYLISKTEHSKFYNRLKVRVI